MPRSLEKNSGKHTVKRIERNVISLMANENLCNLKSFLP